MICQMTLGAVRHYFENRCLMRKSFFLVVEIIGYSPLAGMRTRAVREHLAPCHSPI